MRSEQDIINLRAQYQEQLDTVIQLQREFSERLDLNSTGVTREIEVPLKKVLELEIERLDWILNNTKYYPGPYYRTVESDFSFERFVQSRWTLNYSSYYDYCKVHGTFERGDICFSCTFDYKEANPPLAVALPIDGVENEA